MTLKVNRFLEANARSPVVYGSVDGRGCTYRLANGSIWNFNRRDALEVGQPRWSHLEAA